MLTVVSINVAQLLKSPVGTVRELEFSERLPAPTGDLHLRGPAVGRVRLLRTSRGILVSSEHHAPVALECARCLRDVTADVDASFEEEFLPSLDLRTGLPAMGREGDEDAPRIDEHHEVDLDELLRQSLLTSLPLQPLCEAACPGLCPTCGQRLDERHGPHAEPAEVEEVVDTRRPFAGLAELLREREQGAGSNGR